MSSWKNLAITIVAPSRWLANEAQCSSLFKDKRIEVIPHGTDLSTFKPLHKQFARKILGLPEDVDLVLFGSTGGTGDERKGFQYLLPALKVLSTHNEHKNIQLLVFGESAPHTDVSFGFPVHFIGRLRDDISLSVLYAAADVTVTPSLQEAFGMTASESMACGTPVVAFGASGPLDVIDHKINGYLAEPYDIKDLSNGISWVLACKQRWHKLSIASRQKCIDCFDLQIVANKYSSLYEELLSSF